MTTKSEELIFRKGSKTYFFSSLFFPKNIRDDIFTLYAFVRTADDFVDAVPQKKEQFLDFQKAVFDRSLHDSNEIIKRYISLSKRNKFDNKWTKAFLSSMESDLHKNIYASWQELDTYMYGSAEVIGLMIARIMNLPDKALPYAHKLGKAMQLINFIRDIKEDNDLGRQYIPIGMLKKYGLHSLLYEEVKKNKESFENLVRELIRIYELIQNEAEKGYSYIPKRYKIAVKTAGDMYKYTAQKILKNPMIVYEKKVKPSLFRIIITGVKNIL